MKIDEEPRSSETRWENVCTLDRYPTDLEVKGGSCWFRRAWGKTFFFKNSFDVTWKRSGLYSMMRFQYVRSAQMITREKKSFFCPL